MMGPQIRIYRIGICGFPTKLFFLVAIDEHEDQGHQTDTDSGKHRYHNNSVIPIDQGQGLRYHKI